MKEVWLIGSPRISTSPSPTMQQAAFDEMQLPWRYLLKPIPDDATEEEIHAVFALAEQKCVGINVTNPYKKIAAARYQHIADKPWGDLASINTVVFAEQKAIRAANTDVIGLQTAWKRAAINVAGQTVAIVGNGATAKSVLAALAKEEAAQTVIAARTDVGVQEMLYAAHQLGIRACAHDSKAAQKMAPYLIVFAVSQLDDPADWLARIAPKHAGTLRAVHDVRYGPAAHPLRNAALHLGTQFLDGTSMLLAQGQAALSLWAGRAIPSTAATAMTHALAYFVAAQRNALHPTPPDNTHKTTRGI